MTPRQLQAAIEREAQAEADALATLRKLAEAGGPELLRHVGHLVDLAETHQRTRRIYEAELQKVTQGGNHGRMVAAARLKISRGKSDDALVIASDKAGMTVRDLATKLRGEGHRVSHSLLFQARAGRKSLRTAVAQRIQALTGFPADAKHWRGGLI